MIADLIKSLFGNLFSAGEGDLEASKVAKYRPKTGPFDESGTGKNRPYRMSYGNRMSLFPPSQLPYPMNVEKLRRMGEYEAAKQKYGKIRGAGAGAFDASPNNKRRNSALDRSCALDGSGCF